MMYSERLGVGGLKTVTAENCLLLFDLCQFSMYTHPELKWFLLFFSFSFKPTILPKDAELSPSIPSRPYRAEGQAAAPKTTQQGFIIRQPTPKVLH